MRYLILIMILILGCSTNDSTNETDDIIPSEADIRMKILQTGNDLISYTVIGEFSLNMSLEVQFVTTKQPVDISAGGFINLNVDRKNNMAYQHMNMVTTNKGFRATLDMYQYHVDDVVYENENDDWIKYVSKENSYDLLKMITAVVDEVSFEVVGEDIIGKHDCYEIYFNLDRLVRIDGVGLTEIFSENGIEDMSLKIWVDKDDFHIIRQEQILEGEFEDSDGEIIKAKVKMLLTFTGFNKDIIVSLPDDAKDAVDMTPVIDYGDSGSINGLVTRII